VVALLLLGVGQPGALAPAIAGALAVALARPAAALAATSIAAAMRSADLADMGETFKRMRLTSLALLVGSLAMALAAAPKFAARAGWQSAWFGAAALVLVGIALLRPYGAAAHLELRRRRAFEPTRVREVLPAAAYAALALALAGVLAVALACITPWLSFLAGRTQAAAPVATLLLWLGFGLGGAAVGTAIGIAGGRRAIAVTARAHGVVAGWVGVATHGSDRFLRRAGLRIVELVEVGGLEAGEGALGRALRGTGGWELGRLVAGGAALAFAVAVVVVAAVVGGLLAPGVVR
jgi:NADH:ubiquinone oxidoreductase subunit 5 (subunit L)/multisubunit Na+/H+ antiporter MnhA subunit